MFARITLRPTAGPLEGHPLVFTERTLCTVGRSSDCLLHLGDGDASLTVSRRHCLLDIDPPSVRVRDLGSLNGTYVNGRKIGQREKGRHPEVCLQPADDIELHDGDRLAVGDAEFVVGVETAPSGEGREWHGKSRPVGAADDSAADGRNEQGVTRDE